MSPRPRLERMTERQGTTLAALIAGHRELGTAPSVKWIMERIGVVSTATVIGHLSSLERWGFVRVVDGKRIATPAGYKALNLLTLAELEEAVSRLMAGKADGGIRARIRLHFAAVAKIAGERPRAG
jgi:DNA-binding HxlR family transcriptional regulator